MSPRGNESKTSTMSEAGLDQGVAGAPTSGESDASSDKRVSAGALSESDESLDTVDDDIDKMLSELQDFQEELETKSKSPTGTELPSPSFPTAASDPLDQFRLSMDVIEGTGEVDLDALLEDLCVMERDINSASAADTDDKAEDMDHVQIKSPISPTAKVTADVRNRLENVQQESKELTPEEQQERIKAEKIRIALEKLRAARIKKLVIKVYNDDDPTSKTLAIDQTWTAWDVCKKMMKKNDAEPDPNWVLVERMPDLHIERLLEDHECVVDVVSSWPWDSNNKLVLNNRREKYALFRNPQNYLLSSDTSTGAAQLAEKSKDILLTEYFKKDAMRLPEMDGVLHLKEGKRSWKKHYFALRASGVYVNPKGKNKSSKDLTCLIKPEYVNVYYGLAIKKKLKAPTEFCFVLKSPQHNSLDSKAFVCLCADEQRSMQRWMVAIRIAKYGYRMLEDYSETQDEMDKLAFTLDRNRFTRNSFSAPSVPSQPTEPELQPQLPVKDYSLKARVQSERLKQSTVQHTGYPGSASFSLRRTGKEPARKNSSKNISNLFSDAWKKGTEKHFEPATPDYATIGLSPGAATPNTPNTKSPKAFVMEANRAIKTLDEVREDDDDGEDEDEDTSPPPPPLPKATAALDDEPEAAQETPPLPRKLSATRGLADSGAEYAEIPDVQASQPPPRPLSDADIPPPPPPVPSTPRPSMSGNAGSRANSRPPASSPLPVPYTPSVSYAHVGSPPFSPESDEVFHPPTPPPKAKHMAPIPPPAPLTLDPPSLHSSTDSLPLPPPPSQFVEDDMPLPPPPAGPPVGDSDFPPPPPEVVLKDQIAASLLRRSQSSKHPPPPPPKANRPRLSNRAASFN